MKTKKIQIGMEVPLPDGTTGIIVEELPIGEFRVEGENLTFFLFPEDIRELLEKEGK
jgi:hypothetical protein